MNLSSLATLLQVAATLLLGVQHNPSASPAMMQQAIAAANRTVQLATQATTEVPFAEPQTSGLWINIDELAQAPYLDASGKYAQLGTTVNLIEADTSFGDLNNDGHDDAAVIVQQSAPSNGSGAAGYALAAVLNQNGSLFNIANMPLGPNVQIISHEIVSGGIIELKLQIGNQPPATYQYELVGNQLMKI